MRSDSFSDKFVSKDIYIVLAESDTCGLCMDFLLFALDCGATLCDVMGDIFCKHPEELTDNDEAIQKQMKLIEKLHSLGAEVLMSSHLYKFAPAERVLEIALEQKRRGADIIKIGPMLAKCALI